MTPGPSAYLLTRPFVEIVENINFRNKLFPVFEVPVLIFVIILKGFAMFLITSKTNYICNVNRLDTFLIIV